MNESSSYKYGKREEKKNILKSFSKVKKRKFTKKKRENYVREKRGEFTFGKNYNKRNEVVLKKES